MARPLAAVLAACAMFGTVRAHAQTTIFSTDFNSGLPSQFSGSGGVESVQGFAGLGSSGNQFSGDFLRNDSVPATASTLTLTGLPAHSSVNLGFLLAAIDSWDSTDGGPAPDFFNVSVDSTSVFQATFATASGSFTYGGVDIGSGQQQRGFNGSWNDRAYDLYTEPLLQNIPHTASTLTVSFFASGGGWQGGIDESWAIDNLRVQINGSGNVPEPGAAGLLCGALAGMGMLLRRRRK